MSSYTTRPPRPGDGRGKSYEHVTRDEFERLRDGGRLLEWAEVHGELYGTPREAVERLLAEGSSVLLEIDVQGAKQVLANEPSALSIFLAPPDWPTLEARLRARGTEDEDKLRKRLSTARRELDEAGRFGHHVINDQLEQAVEAVDRILEQASEPDGPPKTR